MVRSIKAISFKFSKPENITLKIFVNFEKIFITLNHTWSGCLWMALVPFNNSHFNFCKFEVLIAMETCIFYTLEMYCYGMNIHVYIHVYI